MITVKGRTVTFTGDDAEDVQRLAALMKTTPEKAVNAVLTKKLAAYRKQRKSTRS